MSRGIRITALGAALVLGTISGTAEAAKGVKKNNSPESQHVVTGQIVKVTYHNGGGSIFLKTPHNIKINQDAAGATTGTNQVREFQATTSTRLVNYNGTPGNPNSLRRGVRVRLVTTGTNTSAIQIMTHPQMSGRFARTGNYNYHPHMMNHQTLHPNHHRRF